jgi:hypothetical protein
VLDIKRDWANASVGVGAETPPPPLALEAPAAHAYALADTPLADFAVALVNRKATLCFFHAKKAMHDNGRSTPSRAPTCTAGRRSLCRH